MLFKDIKQNAPVFILDKQEFCITQGKVTADPLPRLEMNRKTARSEMVVDVAIEINGKIDTYAIPENLSVTYAGNLVLATDKQSLANAVENLVVNADQILASVPHAKKVKENAPAILANLSPAYKERQETEQRFGKIEGSISEMKGLMQNQQKMLEDFIKKFES